MTKIALSFACGVMFTLGLVYGLDDNRGFMLAAGALIGILISAVVVYRLRKHFLPIQTTHRIHRVVERVPVVHMPVTKVDCKADDQNWIDKGPDWANIKVDVISALVNMGMTKKHAVKVVHDCVEPGMTFEEAFRTCTALK